MLKRVLIYFVICCGYFVAMASKEIPKVIFVAYEDSLNKISDIHREAFNKIARDNGEYVVVYFSANESEQFVKRFYPMYLKLYQSLRPSAYRSDMLRYFLLYRYGGIFGEITLSYNL